MNKRGLITGLIVILVLLVVGFFWFVGQMNKGEELVENCVKIQTTCCPCNMGGQEMCVLESQVSEYEINSSECSPTMICSAVFNCEIESCEYVDGECVAA